MIGRHRTRLAGIPSRATVRQDRQAAPWGGLRSVQEALRAFFEHDRALARHGDRFSGVRFVLACWVLDCRSGA